MYVNVCGKKRDDEGTTHKNPIEEKAGEGRCIRRREKKECSRKSGVTPNCMPDSDCIFHLLYPLCLSLPPSLSLLLSLLSSVPSFSIFHWYFRATHPLATYGTPVRKRGVRNVIVPLRGVSWYKTVVLFLILPFSFRSLSADNVCPEETSDRVYYASSL